MSRRYFAAVEEDDMYNRNLRPGNPFHRQLSNAKFDMYRLAVKWRAINFDNR